MRYLATILITLLLAVLAMSVELFRYRGAAKDGGKLEYVFETDEQDAPRIVTKRKSGGDRRLSVKGPIKNMFFVALLPDGTVVKPRVARRM